MGVEKQGGSKGGGGYVGGILHLFDWNTKSRKKLFSSKSDLPEQPKQKKRSDGNLPMMRFHMIDNDDIDVRSSIRGSSDYSCASSVTDEDDYGSKPTGIIARLMGLDSLPASTFSETYSTTSYDSQSIRDRTHSEVHQDHQVLYSGPLRSNIESKPQKTISRPFEKFRTETLPPKSAKSIPTTHHKLLSPIKSAGFVSSSSRAHIMDAAAKIIESGSRQCSTTTGVKMPLVGSSSSSAPLRFKDLKEKAEVEASRKPSPKLGEASRRPVESNAAKYLKGQSMNKSLTGLAESKSSEEDCSTYSKSKGKSISLALQAKVNVQKREGLNNSGRKGWFFGEKVENDALTSQPLRSQSAHKKTSTHNASSSVLRQNNQKKNCGTDKVMLPSKTVQNRKPASVNSSLGRQKHTNKQFTNPKNGSRKMGSDSKKEEPYHQTKKRSINGNFHLDKNLDLDNINKGRKLNKSDWAEESKRNGTDVISFTFTAPMTRSTLPSPERSREGQHDFRGKKMLVNLDGNNGSKLTSLSYNVIGGGSGDALSTLLEQKLRELTNGVEFSRHRAGIAGSSVSIFHDMVPNFNAGSTTPVFYDKRSGHDQIHIDDLSSQASSVFSSNDPLGLMRKHKLQDVEDEYSSIGNFGDPRKLHDRRHPSPISVLEPYFFAESCNSSDTMDSNSTEGYRQSSSVQAQEVVSTSFTELSDSASSSSSSSSSSFSSSSAAAAAAAASADASASSSTKKQVAESSSINWELKYVKTIISNIDIMFRDFALGRTHKIINPQLYDQLENEKPVFEIQENDPKQRRRVLFDCVSECVDLRCKVWVKGLTVVERKEVLAKDVYKEIKGWDEMVGASSVVDELVDKDMSGGKCGRWLDFEVEMFEMGIEIEKRILNSLINEVVADMLVL